MMTQFTPITAAIGGSLIGIAAVALMGFNGRIAGISGILNGLSRWTANDRAWRLLFLLGLMLGGLGWQLATHERLITRDTLWLPQLIAAGFLVGFGTRLGNGCTSGHGVCGSARLSRRSIAATVTFLLVGMATATLLANLIGASA